MLVSFTLLLVLGGKQLVSAATVDWTTITNSKGDHLPDFSYCGYHSSDDSLPSDTNAASVVIEPKSGDQTAQIQAALDSVAAAGGGVVKLDSGTFQISPGLSIQSNVVLRGAGTGGTVLSLKSLVAKESPVISLGKGTSKDKATIGKKTSITDSYVGIGASSFTVADASGFSVGQKVYVQRAITAAWVRDNGMADLVRNNSLQTWIAASIEQSS